jgi:hypothetical protein
VATHTLAIHLAADHATAVTSQTTLRSLRLSGLLSGLTDDPSLAELIAGRRWDRVVSTLPADAAYFRFLDLPFRDRRRLALAVGPTLEEHVPLSLDEAVTGFDRAGSDKGAATLAVMARREAIEARFDELARIGVVPSPLIWEPLATFAAYRASVRFDTPSLCVDLGIGSTVVACAVGNRLLGLRVVSGVDEPGFVRDLHWAVRTLEATTDRVVVGGPHFETGTDRVREALEGMQVETLPPACPMTESEFAHGSWRTMTTALGLVLIATGQAESPVISFPSLAVTALRDSVEARRDLARSLGPWAAATLLLLGSAAAVDYGRLYRTASQLERTAERAYTTALPAGSGGTGRRTKIELRLRELETKLATASGAVRSDGPLGMLVTLSQAIPADLEVEFESYAYDPPNVRMRGRGSSFESVTKLQQVLRDSASYGSVDVGDVRSSASGTGVDFELLVRLGEKS